MNERIKIANLATELFPWHQSLTAALGDLIKITQQFIEDLECHDKLIDLSNDPCYHYETESTPDWEIDDDPW